MIVISSELYGYILNKFGLVNKQNFKENENKVILYILSELQEIKKSMFVKNFTSQEIATMILNEDNPKTMDYFFMKLLKVKLHQAGVGHDGTLNVSMRNGDARISSAFSILARQRNFERGQIYFAMDIHSHQIFPKSRSFRICSRKLLPISIKNPNAGKIKKVAYGNGYVAQYSEPEEILQKKHIMLYCRNAWERKGEIKPSRAKDKKEEVVSTSAAVESANVTDGAACVI